ncbi:RING finger protein 10 [Oopsacas minuta]|uniref:E3 ubiquitin-protein ligase RNF10 n=1 Tax=Oopsacas minuta TaxID=111878 RepID=A0AAV7KDA8_9METZ|nr:RING finger protein 10 [Oopsacas minuta]
MSQAAKNKVTIGFDGSEELLAKCHMTGQKGRRVKLDATHLLNFTTDTHKYHGQHGAPSSAQNRARRSAAYTRGYTKEHYLLSNARFVVQQGLDCEGYLFNPDQMFPWEVILQIYLITTSLSSCPICLSRPEAARVTKCGHTYCLPCIMHFFSSAEGKWEPCPVCGEIIKLSDSKPVVILQKREFKRGDMVNFVQVCRPVDLNYPLPCYLDRGTSRELLTCSDKGVQFAKILTADNQFKKQTLIRDRNEMYRILKDKLCDVTFVQNALKMINSELREYDNPEIIDSATNVFADEFVCPEGSEILTEIDSEMSSKYNQEDWVFTYQSADGQYIFLDPLNAAMLREEYGMLCKSPDRIRAQILNITHHVVTEQLRSRFKWLSHLPLMCELQFFEVSFKPPLISRYVLDNFRDTVEKRRINRQIKQKQEEVSDKKAAAYWNKTYPSLLVSDPGDQLPDFSIENFTPLPSTITNIVTEPTQLSSSFAQALSHQHTLSKDITSNPHENTPIDSKQDHSSESDDEFAPPINRESLSNVIATKLDAYLLQKDLEGVHKSKVQSGPTRSKRGKGKKIVLFSTSSGRPS